ncbi:hypothetical protein SAMN04487779_10765 [Belnapia rosea]|uniref:Phage integrase family protein n=1 Tax=Belnapia rosea TaxID=938405 RepID=A0A1G7EH53_9PROT|nr:hypothetical protein SAMN04487779_10765 [Belnapia rosea]
MPLPEERPVCLRRRSWLDASDCQYGPVFRKVDRWGSLEQTPLHPNALPKILARHVAKAGLTASGLERLSAHGLRAGFITEGHCQVAGLYPERSGWAKLG